MVSLCIVSGFTLNLDYTRSSQNKPPVSDMAFIRGLRSQNISFKKHLLFYLLFWNFLPFPAEVHGEVQYLIGNF